MPVSSANKMQKYATALSNVSRTLLGKNLSRAVSNRAVDSVNNSMPSYAKGGKVRRTGKAKLHKNEVVLPVKTVRALKRLMK
jgi:hypothetical protein